MLIRADKIWILLAALAVTACSKESVPDHVHATTAQAEMPAPDPSTLTGKMVTDSTVAVLQAAVADESNDPMAAVVEPLKRDFFRAEVLLKAENVGSQRDELLRLYNKGVLRIQNANPRDSRLQPLLADYERMVMLGCSQELTHCRLVPVFQRAANSFDIWKLVIASPAANIRQERARLILAWKLSNERETQYINLKYLEKSEAIEADLRANPSKEMEKAHFDTVERILASPEGLRGQPIYDAYVRKLLDSPITGSIQQSRTTRLRESALLSEAKNGILRQEWFVQSLRKHYGQDASGYEVARKFVAEFGPQVKANLEVKEITEKDALYYLVDNVYTGTWSAPMAHILWKESLPKAEDENKLHALIHDYVQMQMLSLVVHSHRRMGEFYKNRTTFQSNMIHIEAYKTSQELQDRWLKLYTSVERIRNLAKLVYGSGTETMRALRLDQDSLNETSMFLVSYPQLLLMAYHMAVEKFELRNWWSTLDHTLVIQKLFEGDIDASFFDYTMGGTQGMKQFSPTELLYAFHYALKTEAFTAMGTDANRFITLIAQEMIKSAMSTHNYERGFREYMKLWTVPVQTLQNEYSELIRICKVEKEIDALPAAERATRQAAPRAYTVFVPLEEIGWGLLTQTNFAKSIFDSTYRRSLIGNDHSSPLRHGLSFYSNEHEQSIEHARVNLGERLKYVEDMAKIYRAHLLHVLKGDEKAVDEQMASINDAINEAKHNSRRFYAIVFQRLEEMLMPCMSYLARKEFDLQNQLINTEYEWLKQLYRDYHKLRALSPESGEAKAILARYSTKGFESQGYTGFDRFDMERGQFLAHRMDAVVRYARHMRQGLVTDTANMPAINPSIEFNLAKGALKEVEHYKNKQPVFFRFDGMSDEDQFATTYIKTMKGSSIGDKTSFAFYNVSSHSWASGFLEGYTALLAGLLKTGEVEAYAPGQPRCLSDSLAKNCAVVKKVLTPEMLREQHYQILSLAVGNEADQDVFKKLGIKVRGWNFMLYDNSGKFGYVVSWANGLLVNTSKMKPMGFYDIYHILLAQVRLGWFKRLPWGEPPEGGAVGEPSLTALEKGRQYYEAQLNEQLFVFPMRKEVSDYLFQSYKKRVVQEFAGPKMVQSLASDSEAQDLANKFVREYPVQHADGDKVKSYYLDPNLKENQNTVETDYHRQTGYIFLDGATE